MGTVRGEGGLLQLQLRQKQQQEEQAMVEVCPRTQMTAMTTMTGAFRRRQEKAHRKFLKAIPLQDGAALVLASTVAARIAVAVAMAVVRREMESGMGMGTV